MSAFYHQCALSYRKKYMVAASTPFSRPARVKPRFELLQIMMRPKTKYLSVSRTAADLLDKIPNPNLLDGNKILGISYDTYIPLDLPSL